jgi:hypothetical protein
VAIQTAQDRVLDLIDETELCNASGKWLPALSAERNSDEVYSRPEPTFKVPAGKQRLQRPRSDATENVPRLRLADASSISR